MTVNKPNKDASNDGSLSGVLGDWIKHYIRENLDDMLPARVVSYDDASNRATVQILVAMKTTEGKKVSRANFPNVHVFRFGGGGFFLRFPLKSGDFGWIKANDRDISLVFQRGGSEDIPNTERLHSFSDAVFIPDTIKGWTINDSDAVVFQSMSGDVCIALHDDKITIDAPDRVDITAPDIKLKGNVEIEGGLTTHGGAGIALTGGSITHNGTNIGDTHTHSGVQSGGSNTGSPT